jgi:hypothetical protein
MMPAAGGNPKEQLPATLAMLPHNFLPLPYTVVIGKGKAQKTFIGIQATNVSSCNDGSSKIVCFKKQVRENNWSLALSKQFVMHALSQPSCILSMVADGERWMKKWLEKRLVMSYETCFMISIDQVPNLSQLVYIVITTWAGYAVGHTPSWTKGEIVTWSGTSSGGRTRDDKVLLDDCSPVFIFRSSAPIVKEQWPLR